MSEKLRLRYVTDGCLLLVNKQGCLRILYTPFKALCIEESFGLAVNTWVYVEAVFHHNQFLLGYLILDKIHPYNRFQIIISF